jgi:hypothetical protein
MEPFLEVKSKKNSPKIRMAKKMVLDILNLEDGMPKLYQTAVTNKSTSRYNPEEPRSHLFCRKKPEKAVPGFVTILGGIEGRH